MENTANKELLSSYAIFHHGGKQYQAVIGKTEALEKIEIEVGQNVSFDKVLLTKKSDKEIVIGKPFVNGAAVNAEVISQGRGRKVTIFRFKRRKRIHVKNGHRQPHTIVRFKEISFGK